MHEEQDHQDRLGDGDRQRHQRIQREMSVERLLHVDLRGKISGDGAYHQRRKDQQIHSNGDYVFRHSFTYPMCGVRLIK